MVRTPAPAAVTSVLIDKSVTFLPTGTGRREGQGASCRDERFFALLTERALKRAVFRSVAEHEKAIKAYIEATNADPKPFRCAKTADDILASIQRFCLRTLAANA